MKNLRYLLLIILFLCHQTLIAQYFNFSQSNINFPALNPAFTGVEDYLDVKLGFRQGLSSIDNNGQYFVSAYGVIQKNSSKTLRHNTLRLSNQTALKELNSSKKLRKRHGVGGMMKSYELGSFQLTGGELNYSFHLPISPKFMWSLGTVVGLTRYVVDVDNLQVRDEINDIFFQTLINSSFNSQSLMHIDFGSVLYSDKLFFSIGSNSLVQKNFANDEGLNVIRNSSYHFVIGMISNSGPYLELYPLGGVSVKNSNVEWSLGARLRYRKIVSFGARYFDKTKITGLFGLHLDTFSFQYAYDTYVDNLGTIDANVHEIILGVSLFNRFNNKTRFW